MGATSCRSSGSGLTDCGPGKENCCTSPVVTGGTFYRSYDGVTYTDQSYPATVSDFRLDRYEVTVGRFREFVDAWDAGWRPAAGDGKHAYLNNGNGLVAASGGYEKGWEKAANSWLPGTKTVWDSQFSSCAPYSTWTPTPGSNEHRPIDCVSWYDAYAFCIWDGGFLPSEAEWNYAAAGGSEQRVFPWSSPPTSTTLDCTYANYSNCNGNRAQDVGSTSPRGDGKWGQADLAGNVFDWNLDGPTSAYPLPCTDCTDDYLMDAAIRGGGFDAPASNMLVSYRATADPIFTADDGGIRCARAP